MAEAAPTSVPLRPQRAVAQTPSPSKGRAASPPFSPPLSPPDKTQTSDRKRAAQVVGWSHRPDLSVSTVGGGSLSSQSIAGIHGQRLLPSAIADPRGGTVSPTRFRQEVRQAHLTGKQYDRQPDRGASVGRGYTKLLSNLQLTSDIAYELHAQHKSVAARAGARKFRGREARDDRQAPAAPPLLVPPLSAGFSVWVGEPGATGAGERPQWWTHPRPDEWRMAGAPSVRSVESISKSISACELGRKPEDYTNYGPGNGASYRPSTAGVRAPLPKRPESAGCVGERRARPLSAACTGTSHARARAAGRAALGTAPGPVQRAQAAARERRRAKHGTGQLTPSLADGGRAGLLMLLGDCRHWGRA